MCVSHKNQGLSAQYPVSRDPKDCRSANKKMSGGH